MTCELASAARALLARHDIPCNQVHDHTNDRCTVVVEPGMYTLYTMAEVQAFVAGVDYAEDYRASALE